MKQINSISLIVPAYKQGSTIIRDIKRLDKTLLRSSIPYEIIIVVDGFIDNTYTLAKKLARKNIRVIGYRENRGKGYAVKAGIEKANGDIIGFIDSGMELDPTGVSMLLNHMIWYDADIIVGSKLHPVSQVNYPPIRKILSWGYRTFTHLLFGFRVRDTQVGLKLFRKKVAKDVFPRLQVKQFAFDVEILAVAYALGHRRIFEAPVKLNFSEVSSSIRDVRSIKFWRTIFLMLWDTVVVFYRIKITHSHNK